MEKVTYCDIGGQVGLKFGICVVTALLNGRKPMYYKHY